MFLLNRRRRTFSPPPRTRRLRAPRWRPSPATIRMVITAAVIALLLAALFVTASFWVNWWWFDSLGYRSVLVDRYLAMFGSFLVGGVLAAAVLGGNLALALRRGQPNVRGDEADGVTSRRSRAGRWSTWLIAVVAFLLGGMYAVGRWERWLLLVNGGEFGISDPTFGRDVGFYVFTLPALDSLTRAGLVLVAASLLIVVLVEALRLGVRFVGRRSIAQPTVGHLSMLAAVGLILIAAQIAIATFELVYSNRGAVFGPGYTDDNVVRRVNLVLAVITVALAVMLAVPRLRRTRWLLIGAGAWFAVGVVFGLLLPPLIQEGFVEPSELRRERPYIARNIEMTRLAFDIDGIAERELAGAGEPAADTLAPDNDIWANVRLWDYRVAQSAFQQISSFVPYYRFVDVDVDRYDLDGQLRQVLVSARELDIDGLPPNARTWVNQHLVYTHGHGVVVAPVNEASRQGLPTFLVGQIPAEGTGALTIEQPNIYFGEVPGEWVAVNTEQAEFSGLEAQAEPATYAGQAHGSIALDSYLRKLMLAVHLGDRRLLLSGELTDDSRVLLRRQIVERVESVAPFLSLDPDPYLVIVNGRLVWLIDAYTTTDRFPSSTPWNGISYLRLAAKVTVDAYDGTTTFYRTEIDDPIADAYSEIYPDLFTPIDQAPPELVAHFRYPERLFDAQAEVFSNYHIVNPDAFYNGEDRWAIPPEQVNDQQQRMEAYYVTTPLPGESDSRFRIVLPFVPGGQTDRQNMTAWIAGQTDAGGATDLVVYRFPRQVNVFGPQQVAARISQDPTISSQITLLNQVGSRVIRGNMLVIPVDRTVIYVQPLYVQATDTDAAPPELKFVIIATNESVLMRPTLGEALQALRADIGQSAPSAEPERPASEPIPAPPASTANIAEALAAFERAEAAARAGDWTAYDQEVDRLGELLRALVDTDTAGAAPTVPAATPTP